MSESNSPHPMTPDEVREEIRKHQRDGGARFTESSVRLLLDQSARTDATMLRIHSSDTPTQEYRHPTSGGNV